MVKNSFENKTKIRFQRKQTTKVCLTFDFIVHVGLLLNDINRKKCIFSVSRRLWKWECRKICQAVGRISWGPLCTLSAVNNVWPTKENARRCGTIFVCACNALFKSLFKVTFTVYCGLITEYLHFKRNWKVLLSTAIMKNCCKWIRMDQSGQKQKWKTFLNLKKHQKLFNP